MKRKRFGLLVNWFSKSCLLGVVYHRVSTGDAELVLIDLGCGGSLRCDGVPSRPPLTKLLNVQNLGIQRDCSGIHKPLWQDGITQPLVNPSQMLFGPTEVKSASRLNREAKTERGVPANTGTLATSVAEGHDPAEKSQEKQFAQAQARAMKAAKGRR